MFICYLFCFCRQLLFFLLRPFKTIVTTMSGLLDSSARLCFTLVNTCVDQRKMCVLFLGTNA